ncbi:uncharacterized protein [Nicotiana sylvestris]|uniref:uncharacterized protein n=1 Tax=Nicotiana sylvestris TaxID=4096 RepID=UPI00388C4467
MAKLKAQWGIRIEKHRRHLNQSKRDHEKTVAKMKKEMAILEIKAADQAKNFQIESRYWYDSLAQMKLEGKRPEIDQKPEKGEEAKAIKSEPEKKVEKKVIPVNVQRYSPENFGNVPWNYQKTLVMYKGKEVMGELPENTFIGRKYNQQSIRTVKLTNIEAEYEAMIASLELAKSLRAEVIKAKCDSLLMENQANETFEVKVERMCWYLDKVQVTLHQFREWTLHHVPRYQNNKTDALANLGSSVDSDEFNLGEMVQLMNSMIEEGHAEVNSMSLTWDWRNKYIDYLKTGKFPLHQRIESHAHQSCQI